MHKGCCAFNIQVPRDLGWSIHLKLLKLIFPQKSNTISYNLLADEKAEIRKLPRVLLMQARFQHDFHPLRAIYRSYPSKHRRTIRQAKVEVKYQRWWVNDVILATISSGAVLYCSTASCLLWVSSVPSQSSERETFRELRGRSAFKGMCLVCDKVSFFGVSKLLLIKAILNLVWKPRWEDCTNFWNRSWGLPPGFHDNFYVFVTFLVNWLIYSSLSISESTVCFRMWGGNKFKALD